MAIPEQVRKQAEAVKAHFTEQTSTEEGNTAETTEQAEQTEEGQNEAEQHDENQQTQEVEQTSGDETAWQQRYNSLQGMFNAEVPRLHAAKKESDQRIQQLEELLASMQRVPEAPQQYEVPALLSDTERSEYGDSIEVMRKVSREEVSPLFTRLAQIETAMNNLAGTLNTNVIPQVAQVAQQQSYSAQDRFWQGLAQSVPNWQQVNNDREFQSWLLEIDPMAGVPRQQLLENAQQSYNVGRVAAFFNTWLGATGKYKANATAQTNRSTQASELERQVAPGRSRSAGAPNKQNAKTYSPADIATFFDDVRKGKYKGREDERNRIERDIFAAQQDGRIVAKA